MKWLRGGAHRRVLLTKNWAFKFPNFDFGWKAFLKGMVANDNELEFSKVAKWRHLLCPIPYHLPFGFLNVMPRVDVFDGKGYIKHLPEIKKRFDCLHGSLVEAKWDSYGILLGRIVAVDYG
jgi:hypothetical protein